MNEDRPVLSRLWFLACVAFLIFFAFSRLSDLGTRPLHHDEGVNGLFMKNLVVSNDWRYDPENYHGPSLYYLQLIPTWIATYLEDGRNFNRHSIDGLTPVSIRTVVAVAGLLILVGLIRMAPVIGRLGSFVAFLLAGFSLDLLFFSRYFIHETYVVLFTFGIVFGVQRYYMTKLPRFAYLTVFSAIMLFCTKETSVFHMLILALAWLLAETTKWLLDDRQAPAPFERLATEPGRVYRALDIHGPLMMIMATLIWFLLFSSFLKNPRGVVDSLRTYFFWGGEGFNSGHDKPFFYFATSILLPYETPLVVLTVLGLLVAFVRNELSGLFLAYWTLGTIGFYSLVPYKTPWLAENFIVPMALLSGYGVQAVSDTVISRLRALHAGVTLAVFYSAIVLISAAQIPQTFRVTYREYDNDRYPQVYAHTMRDIFDMLARIDAAAVRTGLGHKMVINIFSDQYWPLPFYLLKYDSPLFWGKLDPNTQQSLDAPVIIALPSQRDQLNSRLRDSYAVTTHTLRPGVQLLLYVNNRIPQSNEPIAGQIDLLKSLPAPKNVHNGLKMEVFAGSRFEGKPIHAADADASWDFNWDDGEKPYRSPFSIRWTGLIRIENAGKYRFSLDSDDGSWLFIDGQMIIDNGGDHAPVRLSRDANLSAGYHQIELKYYDAMGGSMLRFYWTPPNGREQIVPTGSVYSKS